MKHSIMKVLTGILVTSMLFSQTNVDTRISQAQKLESEKQFKKAFKLYEKIHKDDPENNGITYKLATMAYSAKDFKKAVKYYEKLAPNGNPTVLYNLACSLAMQGKNKKALSALETAVEKGFNQLTLMKTDPDLTSIRDSEAFQAIAKSVKSIENYPEAQRFDFWVGEWNVYGLNDARVGESTIEKILSGNVILENWSGGSGYSGKSFNHYHIDSGKWVQYWVDQSSSRIFFEGNFDSDQNALVYFERLEPGSEKPMRRLTFFDVAPDSVRQFSQLSSDGGENWTVEYDFMYVRK